MHTSVESLERLKYAHRIKKQNTFLIFFTISHSNGLRSYLRCGWVGLEYILITYNMYCNISTSIFGESKDHCHVNRIGIKKQNTFLIFQKYLMQMGGRRAQQVICECELLCLHYHEFNQAQNNKPNFVMFI